MACTRMQTLILQYLMVLTLSSSLQKVTDIETDSKMKLVIRTHLREYASYNHPKIREATMANMTD